MAPGFSKLVVDNYRRLSHLELELRPINVLIGANGAGKSTVLDVFRLLSDSANGRLEKAITEAGGITSLLTANDRSSRIVFQIYPGYGIGVPHVYQVAFTERGYGYEISDERLVKYGTPDGSENTTYIISSGSVVEYYDGKKRIKPNWDLNPLETALSQVPNIYRPAATFRSRLSEISEIHHTLDISPRAPVRLPQALSYASTPGVNGEYLLPCLFTIRETDRDRFAAIEDTLKAAFPTFERLEFPPQGRGLLALGVRDKNFTRPIYANELSEGTLRFLWLVTLLQCHGLPMVTLIDEPEVSLHPEMLRLLAEMIIEASERTQLVIATHSDRFVRFLNSDDLVICDRDEGGGMTARRADELDLTAWLEDYTLDQLWSMGRLGGRS
jgi:predicted ATPase